MATTGESIEQILSERLDELEALEATGMAPRIRAKEARRCGGCWRFAKAFARRHQALRQSTPRASRIRHGSEQMGERMTTKTKSSKPAANADGSKDQLRKAHIELWHSINLLKMIDLTAKEAVDGDARDNDVSLHAISTAAGHAVDRIMTAYAIIDRVGTGLSEAADAEAA
jgi:hypothetical protein